MEKRPLRQSPSWYPDFAERDAPEAPERLRELASWYREFAERAGSTAIWATRLRTAEDLETKAEQIEQRCSCRAP
jgi:hypothetical protein